MATLQVGEKARMYAIGRVARGGATRGGYVSGHVFITIDGTPVGFGRPLGPPHVGALVDSFTIDDILNDAANTCQFRVTGIVPTAGAQVVVTLGSKNSGTPLFAGIALHVVQGYAADRPANIIADVSCVDQTWLFAFLKVTEAYRNVSASWIAADLVAKYAADKGFTVQNVAPNLPTLTDITFTEQELDQSLSELAQRIGGYWYVDYLKDLHLFLNETRNGDPEALTLNHRSVANLTKTADRTQVLTRVYVEGGGASILGAVGIGETKVPVDAVVMFTAAADVFAKITGSSGSAQLVNFTGTIPGGAGSLVGPGVGPPVAPAVAQAVGAGMAAGTYQYAYTDLTASGETKPSPIATVVVGTPLPPPAAAPTAVPTAGSGLTAGRYQYAYTDLTNNGETTPSPLATVDIGGQAVASPTVAPALTAYQTSEGVDLGVHNYAYTYVTGAGETTVGPAVDVNTKGQLPLGSQAISLKQSTGGPLQEGYYYSYRLTLIDKWGGESVLTPANNCYQIWVGNNYGHFQVTVDNLGNPQDISAFKLYRSHASPNNSIQYSGPWYLVTTIPTNGNQSGGFVYDDYTADGNLGPQPPTTNNAYVGLMDVKVVTTASSDPAVTGVKIYRTRANQGGTRYLVAQVNGNQGAATYYDTITDANLGSAAPGTNTTGNAVLSVALSNIAAGPYGTAQRYIYRTTVGGATLRWLGALADNTTTTFVDTVPDASLGGTPPVNNTSGNAFGVVQVSNVAPGPSPTSTRYIYRTAVNGSQLRLLVALWDNTTTTFLDVNPDANLQGNAPTVDTSGLAQVPGQVGTGSPVILVANIAPFEATGGWAVIGNGEQVIRYTGKSGNTLTGVPTTGIGAIVAAVAYNSTITAAPMVVGLPASGRNSISRVLAAGDSMNFVVFRDNASRQSDLAAMVTAGPGIREEYIQDRRLAIPEARARGDATLAQRPLEDVTLTYTCRDLRTASGKTITVNLPAPFNISGAFKIQRVKIAQFRAAANQYPTFTVTASTDLFSFDDWLRQIEAKA